MIFYSFHHLSCSNKPVISSPVKYLVDCYKCLRNMPLGWMLMFFFRSESKLQNEIKQSVKIYSKSVFAGTIK